MRGTTTTSTRRRFPRNSNNSQHQFALGYISPVPSSGADTAYGTDTPNEVSHNNTLIQRAVASAEVSLHRIRETTENVGDTPLVEGGATVDSNGGRGTDSPGPLESQWTMWKDHVSTNRLMHRRGFEREMEDVYSFNTVRGFHAFWRELPLDELRGQCNIRCFRSGIKPCWEDPINAVGGRLVVRGISKVHRNQSWTAVLMGAIGESFTADNCVAWCGVVLSTRTEGDSIQVWLDNGVAHSVKASTADPPLPPLTRADVDNGIRKHEQALLELFKAELGSEAMRTVWIEYRGHSAPSTTGRKTLPQVPQVPSPRNPHAHHQSSVVPSTSQSPAAPSNTTVPTQKPTSPKDKDSAFSKRKRAQAQQIEAIRQRILEQTRLAQSIRRRRRLDDDDDEDDFSSDYSTGEDSDDSVGWGDEEGLLSPSGQKKGPNGAVGKIGKTAAVRQKSVKWVVVKVLGGVVLFVAVSILFIGVILEMD
eukprot:PhF_6_TR20520/c0_g1_i1/m.29597